MTLGALREAGIEADGEVMDPDPYSAVMDALGEQDYDEIVISTHPETRSGWLRQGLVDRVQRAARRPVEHVVVDLDAERDDVKRTLVVANQTVASRGRSTRAQAEGERGAAALHRDRAAVGGSNGEGDPHERLAHTSRSLERAGLQAVGQVEHHDPYTAIQNALQFYAPDDIVISTFPETRSGWLRGDLIGRVQASTASRSSTWWPGRLMEVRPISPRRASPRAARGERLLARRGPVPRDAAFHHLRGHALRSVLHGLLLHQGRGRGRVVPDRRVDLPKAIAGVNTAILVSSSFTMHWALEGARNENRNALRVGLLTTACSASPSSRSR